MADRNSGLRHYSVNVFSIGSSAGGNPWVRDHQLVPGGRNGESRVASGNDPITVLSDLAAVRAADPDGQIKLRRLKVAEIIRSGGCFWHPPEPHENRHTPGLDALVIVNCAKGAFKGAAQASVTSAGEKPHRVLTADTVDGQPQLALKLSPGDGIRIAWALRHSEVLPQKSIFGRVKVPGQPAREETIEQIFEYTGAKLILQDGFANALRDGDDADTEMASETSSNPASLLKQSTADYSAHDALLKVKHAIVRLYDTCLPADQDFAIKEIGNAKQICEKYRWRILQKATLSRVERELTDILNDVRLGNEAGVPEALIYELATESLKALANKLDIAMADTGFGA